MSGLVYFNPVSMTSSAEGDKLAALFYQNLLTDARCITCPALFYYLSFLYDDTAAC
jgi:hypothetical protein